MNHWWVNQNQTYKQESAGGYLWSPKRNANGHRNPFYEFMRAVAPGDLIFSFAGTVIPAISMAQSFAYESPKPAEFGNAGPNWDNVGWRVDAYYIELDHRIRPADHMDQIGPCLPELYSPLMQSGKGLQGVYLTRVNARLAKLLKQLIGQEVRLFDQFMPDQAMTPRDTAIGLVEWEDHLRQTIEADESLDSTERQSVIIARRGQGKFKEAVMCVENICRITGVRDIEHLRASHIKPWRDCRTTVERLHGENGFLMTPTIDHLFDRGFISFDNNGDLLRAPAVNPDSLKRMGVEPERRVNVGQFSDGQKQYLDYHRDSVFLQARVRG